MIENMQLEKFTAFENLKLDFCPGVNVLIGDNGTGKTHILKTLYSVLAALKEGKRIPDKLAKVFLPKEERIGRLVKRTNKSSTANIRIMKNGKRLRIYFSNHTKDKARISNPWSLDDIPYSVYIPVKEMLANAPGFRSLYSLRKIYFEEVYADIVDKAYLPILKGPKSADTKKLLDMIQSIMSGKVVAKDEQFFLKNKHGELEFTLLAEGVRKFGLLWLLIQNGTLLNGSKLFWDEPEANINPSMMSALIQILLHLQSQGVQIFIATHSYVILKEFELQKNDDNSLRFIKLAHDKNGSINAVSGDTYQDIVPNKISDAYEHIYGLEVGRALRGV